MENTLTATGSTTLRVSFSRNPQLPADLLTPARVEYDFIHASIRAVRMERALRGGSWPEKGIMTERSLNLPALAVAYRRLVLWYGAQIVTIGYQFSLQRVFKTASPVPPVGQSFIFTTTTTEGGLGYAILISALSLMSLVIVVAIMIYTYRTAQALGPWSSSPSLWALAMLLPLVNLVALLALSSKASQVCRANGIPVGLFGPKLT